MKKGVKRLLAISLLMCLFSAIFACLIQTDSGKVMVEDFKIIDDNGDYINAQIYKPKTATPDNPAPLILLSHGSYNNLEHQDAFMVELSRRGFVVISADAYNHGSSAVLKNGMQMTNIFKLVDYAVDTFKFIDPEKVGVSGHSMGGMIVNSAVQMNFEREAKGGENKITAVCTVGYDPVYEDYRFEGVDSPVAPAINWGVIAAKYDEWFFKGETGNPALYLESDGAVAFVNQLDGVDITGPVENHKVYRGTINGKEYIRMINQNTEIHPLNHFSFASSASMVDFFYEAFGTPAGRSVIPSSNQVWIWKELMNLLGLVGIFLFLFPFASMMIHGTKFFAELDCPEPAPAPALNTGEKKIKYWVVYAINSIFPALLVMPVAFTLIGKESFVPSTVTPWFGEPNTNELGGWTLVVGILLIVIFLISNKIGNSEQGIPDCWGVKASGRVIWKSVLLAALTVFTAYVILFFADLVFNVDYRIWVIDMRVFNVQKLVYFIAYVPAWIVFYLANSLNVNGGARVEGRPEWRTLLLSCISNIAGIAVIIFIQYSTIIGSGTFPFNSMRVVNLFPLIVLIPVGTIISRVFFKNTGKIYVGSLVIAFLYAMMTVANTMANATILQ